MNNPRIVAIIPSRYGSTRFQGKPLTLIAGKPMIQRVYERVSLSPKLEAVYVATDDRRIYDAVIRFGGQAIMTSDHHRSGTDRIAEAADWLHINDGSMVINVQGDQPLMDPRCLDQVIQPLTDDPLLGMSTLAFKIINKAEITNPKDVKVVFDANGFALYFSRSPIPFDRDANAVVDAYKHLGVYAYRRWFLETFRNLPSGLLENIEKLEQLRALEYGYKIKVVITEYDSLEVDLPEDIDRINVEYAKMCV